MSKRNEKTHKYKNNNKESFFSDKVVSYTCLHFSFFPKLRFQVYLSDPALTLHWVTPKEISLCDSIIEINCWLLRTNG